MLSRIARRAAVQGGYGLIQPLPVMSSHVIENQRLLNFMRNIVLCFRPLIFQYAARPVCAQFVSNCHRHVFVRRGTMTNHPGGKLFDQRAASLAALGRHTLQIPATPLR